jgi:hypothetical protein
MKHSSYGMTVLTDWARKLYLFDALWQEGAEESFRLSVQDEDPRSLTSVFSLVNQRQALFSRIEKVFYSFIGKHGREAALDLFPREARAERVADWFLESSLKQSKDMQFPMQSLLSDAVEQQNKRIREWQKLQNGG